MYFWIKMEIKGIKLYPRGLWTQDIKTPYRLGQHNRFLSSYHAIWPKNKNKYSWKNTKGADSCVIYWLELGYILKLKVLFAGILVNSLYILVTLYRYSMKPWTYWTRSYFFEVLSTKLVSILWLCLHLCAWVCPVFNISLQ